MKAFVVFAFLLLATFVILVYYKGFALDLSGFQQVGSNIGNYLLGKQAGGVPPPGTTPVVPQPVTPGGAIFLSTPVTTNSHLSVA